MENANPNLEKSLDFKNSKLIELTSYELDFFKKIVGDWGIDLSYPIGKQMLRDITLQFTKYLFCTTKIL